MSENTRQNAIEQEGRIVLAINVLKQAQILKIRVAACLYGVPEATLRHRLRGRVDWASVRANGLRLTGTEEESLKKWIILLASRGAAPRPDHIKVIANILISKCSGTLPLLNLGKNWVSNFLRRNKDLKSKYIWRYNYQRAKCEDPRVIGEFYDTFQKAIIDYGILDDDI